ncbi:MAG: amidohydrolase [Spirochaetales bacterium]|nr:amidohydrolase [Spirochaetales bacterium]
MRTLIKNALILPMTERNLSFVGDISIKDGFIERINGTAGEYDEVIDANGKIALPAFVNGHTHLSMVLMRNYKDTCSNLMEWLSQIWPIEDKLNADDIYYSSLLGAAELIKSGCTVFADMYFQADNTIKALKEAGIRGIIGQTFFGDEEEAKRRIRENVPILDAAIDGDDRYRIDAAVHAIYTCTDGCYKVAREWIDSRDGYMNTHLAETEGEVLNSIKDFGMKPAQYLKSLGVLNKKTYLAHGVWLDDEELKIIKESGASIIHNPSSNCKLASGIANVAKYRKMGINVGLGTDGASSNNNLNMLKEMNLASMISTVSNMDPGAVTPYDIISMATKDGAEAIGLGNKIGTIEEGKEADILLLDMSRINTTPTNDPFSAIVFSADTSNVDTLFCKGKKILENGTILTLDEKEVMEKTNKQWEDILRR